MVVYGVAHQACSLGNPAMAGVGGVSGSGGTCQIACPAEAFTSFEDPCSPPDSTHMFAFARHDFAGVSETALARIVAVAHHNDGSLDLTTQIYIGVGFVETVCGGAIVSYTFIAPTVVP